ncbi:AAA family ATPase [Aeromonas molluscorum]|uniref:SMC domain-containing protein n=1 Tax=Aeromonas molluscorum 848 TaxID=1268236 RepID=R1H4V0_9GAMM|nr:ATP-binding protein [Aeromonas molluscorum]EOD55561.1 SMC domain-containing protein [Aeromonas molluscorum 848]
MIRKLAVNGFKSLMLDQPIELGRVNCFIGANGVGKSNLLEALGVLGAAANGVVDDESLLRRGVRAGVPRLYKSSFASERTPAHIGISVSGELGQCYRVSLLNPLESPEPSWIYKTEFLSDGSDEIIADGVRNRKNLNPQAGLAALKMVELEESNPAAQLMRALQEYAIYCPNTPTLRGISPDLQSRRPIGLNGGLLAEAFGLLQLHLEDQGERGEDVLEEVLELIDWVADVTITSQAGTLLSPKVPRSKHLLKFTDRFMQKSRNELTAYDASEGALYVLFTAALCLLPQSPKVFAIDNLDQALNPRLVASLTKQLSRWLQHQDPQRQLLFTAHNPAVLDGLDLTDPETRLFAVERNSNGLTCFRRIELTPALQSLNQEYPLSRLWLMGHLGAVPNV